MKYRQPILQSSENAFMHACRKDTNGLTLRADLHRLFDAGYVTVSPDYQLKVSDRLNDEYANGRIYYELRDRRLTVLPDDPSNRPSRQALDWYASHVYR